MFDFTFCFTFLKLWKKSHALKKSCISSIRMRMCVIYSGRSATIGRATSRSKTWMDSLPGRCIQFSFKYLIMNIEICSLAQQYFCMHHVYKFLVLFSTSYCKEEMYIRSFVTMVTIMNPGHGIGIMFFLSFFTYFAVPSVFVRPDARHHSISHN